MDSTAVTDFGSFWRTFRQRHIGMLGLAMLLIALFVALFAPQIAPYDPTVTVRVTIDDIYAKPSAAHWLACNPLGMRATSCK